MTLSTGTGDGHLTVEVDAYGSYGSAANTADDATFDPVGATAAAGTTYYSAVYFGPLDAFLAESGALPTNVPITGGGAAAAVSTFTVSNFAFELTQTVARSNDGQTASLVQRYVITNNTGSEQTFVMTRHVDGDMYYVGGLGNDYAGVSLDNNFVFEFDAVDAGNPDASSAYFGILATGGAADAFAIQPFPYTDDIVGGNGIPTAQRNVINGDNNGDRLTDTGYDVTVSVQRAFEAVAAGASVTFTTTTVFGQGSPQEVINGGRFVVAGPAVVVSEADGTLSVPVNRESGSAGTVVLNYEVVPGSAAAGTDFGGGLAGSVTFNNGQTTGAITIPLVNDEVFEADESLVVRLTAVDNGAVLGDARETQVTVQDDSSTLAFQVAGMTVDEDAGTARVFVSRTGALDGTTTVAYATADGTATAGSDFSPATGTLTFGHGANVAFFDVPILNDATPEVNEVFNVTLSGVTGEAALAAPTTATVTIATDEAVVALASAAYTVAEGGAVQVVVNRFGNADLAFTIGLTTLSGSAVGGSDFTSQYRALSFAPGETSKTVTVATLADQVQDPDETFTLSLVNPSTPSAAPGTPGSATVTITDVDTIAPTVTRVDLVSGGGRVVAVAVQFSEAPVLADAEDREAYTLWNRGTDGRLGFGPDRTVPIQSVSFDPGTLTATITPRKALRYNRLFQLSVNSALIADAAGNHVDGNGDGVGGDPWHAFVGRGTSFRYVDADGDMVRLALTGGGEMEVVRAFEGDLRTVTFHNTTPASELLGTLRRGRAGAGTTNMPTFTGVASNLPPAFVPAP